LRLALLKKAIDETRVRAAETHEAHVEKKARRKQARVRAPEHLVADEAVEEAKPRFDLIPEDRGQDTGETKPGAVWHWWKAAMVRLYGPSFVMARWSPKQYGMAKFLLGEYGPDLAQAGVDYFVDHWPEMCQRSKGQLFGVPTINLLVSGMRDQVFGMVQAARLGKVAPSTAPEPPAKNSDEYREPTKPKARTTRIGW
jgi:hypothetical protein